MENGVSLDAQRARIAAYCTAMDWTVSEYIEDAGWSAKSLKRPGMSRILAGIRTGEIERVVVTKLDRATRAVRDLTALIDLCTKHDVALVSLGETLDTSTAAGRMVVNMLGAVMQWEREAIAERTATALAHKRAKGQVTVRFRSAIAAKRIALSRTPSSRALSQICVLSRTPVHRYVLLQPP